MVLTSSLNALSDFAGLAVAIALAYAGLPNFRYRNRVQEHIRKALSEPGLIALLDGEDATAKAVHGHDCWAVLFRLGRLREWMHSIPSPTKSQDNTTPDHNFTKRSDYKSFTWLYASNLDKIISVALGAISGAALWFGALDEIMFNTSNANGAFKRLLFLSGTISFFTIALGTLLALSLAHKYTWEADRKPKNDRNIGVKIIYWLWTVLFILSVVLTSSGRMFLSEFTQASLGDWQLPISFVVVCSSIFLTIGVPLILLLRGEHLTQSMITEANRCIIKIKDEIKGAPRTAKFEDPAD